MMPPDGLRTLQESDAIYLGAIGDPRLPDHLTLDGLLLPIRRGFDQYVCLRPAVLYAGVASPLAGKTPGCIDLVVVRENTEGEYAQAEGASTGGSRTRLPSRRPSTRAPGATA